MKGSFLFKKKCIHKDNEGLESLVVISFNTWLLWLACALVLVILIIWNFTTVLETRMPAKNPALNVKDQPAFPSLSHALDELQKRA